MRGGACQAGGAAFLGASSLARAAAALRPPQGRREGCEDVAQWAVSGALTNGCWREGEARRGEGKGREEAGRTHLSFSALIANTIH